MNPPSFRTKLIGHPIVSLLLYGLAAFFIYTWWSGAGSEILILFAVIVAGAAMKESSSLSSYQSWKQEWDALGGDDSRPSSSADGKAIGRVVFILVWCALGYAIVSQPNMAADAKQSAILVFLVMGFVFAFAGIRWMVRKARSKPAKEKVPTLKDIFVTQQCLPVYSHDASTRQAFHCLPGYCLDMLSNPENHG